MQKPFKIPESVLVVIHTPAMNVLLLRRADPEDVDFWQSVTGSKDAVDEPFFLTASREVWEETGIDCRPGTPMASDLRDWRMENTYAIYPQWAHRYAPGITHNRERVFGLRVPENTAVCLQPREHTVHQWLPWDAAAHVCCSGSNAQAIRRLPEFCP
jgi:dihydroneopterin triphosphate diphosphatase